MPAGAPEENLNAEKWTLEEATKLFMNAIELSREYSDAEDTYTYDFIGEVAREQKYYKEIFTYLKDKYKELKSLHTELVSTLEANCFYNSKKGRINTAIGIVNLKSNHGWTDRVDNTTKGDKVNTPLDLGKLSREELDEILNSDD